MFVTDSDWEKTVLYTFRLSISSSSERLCKGMATAFFFFFQISDIHHMVKCKVFFFIGFSISVKITSMSQGISARNRRSDFATSVCKSFFWREWDNLRLFGFVVIPRGLGNESKPCCRGFILTPPKRRHTIHQMLTIEISLYKSTKYLTLECHWSSQHKQSNASNNRNHEHHFYDSTKKRTNYLQYPSPFCLSPHPRGRRTKEKARLGFPVEQPEERLEDCHQEKGVRRACAATWRENTQLTRANT